MDITPSLPDPHICEQARLSRDARFDGLFFTAVSSTGIYMPAGMPGADAEARERALLRERGGGGSGRIPAMSALPAGTRAGQ